MNFEPGIYLSIFRNFEDRIIIRVNLGGWYKKDPSAPNGSAIVYDCDLPGDTSREEVEYYVQQTKAAFAKGNITDWTPEDYEEWGIK